MGPRLFHLPSTTPPQVSQPLLPHYIVKNIQEIIRLIWSLNRRGDWATRYWCQPGRLRPYPVRSVDVEWDQEERDGQWWGILRVSGWDIRSEHKRCFAHFDWFEAPVCSMRSRSPFKFFNITLWASRVGKFSLRGGLICDKQSFLDSCRLAIEESLG